VSLFEPDRPTSREVVRILEDLNARRQRAAEPFPITKKEPHMHYRNGREAKNGDRVVQLDHAGGIAGVGILHSATPGNDYCNGQVASIQAIGTGACMVDCLHADDLAAILAEKGLDKRPAGNAAVTVQVTTDQLP
jgi:hypothetical protein